jgi:hypothetical protein
VLPSLPRRGRSGSTSSGLALYLLEHRYRELLSRRSLKCAYNLPLRDSALNYAPQCRSPTCRSPSTARPRPRSRSPPPARSAPSRSTALTQPPSSAPRSMTLAARTPRPRAGSSRFRELQEDHQSALQAGWFNKHDRVFVHRVLFGTCFFPLFHAPADGSAPRSNARLTQHILALAERPRGVCSCVASSATLVAQAARARTRTRTAEREKARRRRATRTRRDTRARAAGRRAWVGRWGRASRRRARTSGRRGEQARVKLGLVAAGVCAFKYANAEADAFVVALDGFGRSESALAVHGSPLAPDILAREGYPNAADANEETGGFADKTAARGVRIPVPDDAGAGERARIRDSDGAGESTRRAPARGRLAQRRTTSRTRTCAFHRGHRRTAHGRDAGARGPQERDGRRGRARPFVVRAELGHAPHAVDTRGLAECARARGRGARRGNAAGGGERWVRRAARVRVRAGPAERAAVHGFPGAGPGVSGGRALDERGGAEAARVELGPVAAGGNRGRGERGGKRAYARRGRAVRVRVRGCGQQRARGLVAQGHARRELAHAQPARARSQPLSTRTLRTGAKTRTSWRTGASNAGRPTRAAWASARACSTALARAASRALSPARLFPGPSSGTLSIMMLRTLADSGRALVLANVALAPEQPNGLRRTVTELGVSASLESLQPGLVVSPSPPRSSARSRWRTRRRAVSRVSFWSRASSAPRTS